MFGFEKRPAAPKRHRRLRFETLETRNLLSASPSDYTAMPTNIVDLAPPIANVSFGDVVAQPTVSAFPMASGPSSSFFTPSSIRKAYGFDKLPYDGAGQTIAIVVAFDDPGTLNNLKTFDAQYGLPDPGITIVRQHGPGGAAAQFNSWWATEAAMDVEWAHAIAPKANLMLLEAFDNSYANLMTMVDYARNSTGVSVVSMSFASTEFAGETALDSHFTTPSGHSPVTFVAASGDNGAGAMYPSASPNVLAVGGTKLNFQSYGGGVTVSSESGWTGSGGGPSTVESKPAYQNGFQNTTKRSTPDVAYEGDPATGFNVYFGAGGGWLGTAGTSAGAPQWAGLIALADQGRSQQLLYRRALGNIVQDVYALPASDFNDIVSGGNGAFKAVSGYDMVTGRGSPKADLIVSHLIAAEPLVLVLSPPSSTVAMAPAVGNLKMSPMIVSGNPAISPDVTAKDFSEFAVALNANLPESLPLKSLGANLTNFAPPVTANFEQPLNAKFGLDVLLANIHNGDQVDHLIDSLFDLGHSPSSNAKNAGWDKLDRV